MVIFMQAAGTLLQRPLVVEIILPFLLVFTVVFAILQKTQVLGKDKKQIDAIVALVVGLIVVSFGFATGVIISIVPFFAVSAIVILVFMLLYGMVYQQGKFELHNGVKIAIGILVGVGVLIAVAVATGAWDYIYDLIFFAEDTNAIWGNVIFFIIVAAVVFAVVFSGKKSKDKD